MSRLNDPENFRGRVNYAAKVIAYGHRPTRAFDNCFENYDGDEVATAILRRSRKNARLAANLRLYLSLASIETAAERLADVPTRRLPDIARQTRARRKAEFDAWLAQQHKAEDSTASKAGMPFPIAPTACAPKGGPPTSWRKSHVANPGPHTDLSQLEAAALPHLVDYVTDLTVHDATICRALDPGDAAMYAIRPSGTHFCTYRNVRDGGPVEATCTARKGLDHVDAVHFVARDARWYRNECTGPGIGTVTPITFTEARAVVCAEYDRHSGHVTL